MSNYYIQRKSKWYKNVPKNIEDNLRFRISIYQQCNKDVAMQQAVKKMIAEDTLFFINTFVWTHNPKKVKRTGGGAKIPFVTYSFQDELIWESEKLIFESKEDHQLACVLKSREQGVSWCFLTMALCHWITIPDVSILMISRNKDYVDKPGNKKSLFAKIDYALENLPKWMTPKHDRIQLLLSNNDTGGEIVGEATTGNAGRGDRRTWWFADELAAFDMNEGYEAKESLFSVGAAGFVNSTPKGSAGVFADLCNNPDIKQFRLHWSLHPDKVHGLYTSKNEKLEILDLKYKYPRGYKFILDGKLRSPWYDHACRIINNKKLIAQELDMDITASGGLYFNKEDLDKHEYKYCTNPFHTGRIVYDISREVVTDFIEDEENWNIRLWMKLSAQKRPNPKQRFVVGCDISAGIGSSPSTAAIYDMDTMEQVGEVYTNTMYPQNFAEYIYILCLWLNRAKLNWETNGHGKIFTKTILDEFYYRNIYYEEITERVGKKKTDRPGWTSGINKKKMVFDELIASIHDERIIIRDKLAIAECRQFTYDLSGSPVHSKALNKQDMSTAVENHGDRVIAHIMALLILTEYKKRHTEKAKQESAPPPGSIAFMLQEIERQRNGLGELNWLQ